MMQTAGVPVQGSAGIRWLRRSVLGAVVGLLMAGLGSLAVRAQSGTPAAPAAPLGLSGFWELSFDSRKVPAANLLPTVTRAKIDAHAKADAKAVRWCNLLGLQFLMDSGRPIDIREGKTAVTIVPENYASPRYLYLNQSGEI